MARQVEELQTWIIRLDQDQGSEGGLEPPWDEAERKLLREARGTLSEVRWDMWYATDPDDFLARETARDIDRMERAVARLSYHLVKEGRPLFDSMLVEYALEPSMLPTEMGERQRTTWRDVVVALKGEPAEPAARAFWLERRRSTWTGAIFILGLFGAIFLGMQTVYVGKAFGTVLDYLQALAWGFGSKLTLDVAASALDAVRRSAVPVPLP